MERFNRQQK